MLRRKNPDQTYLQVQTNHSPYRFERKNPTLSPGLSPMRCRTPTRGNISPFRTTNNNDNYRAHSPIKFVTSKMANPVNQMGKGFFRTQTHTNDQAQYNQKYATSNTNNDHSMKRQSFYDNPSSSKINAAYENSERAMLHENTKLFSKLVEKINSEKKKQPQLVRRNTKPEIYRAQQISQVQQKPSGIEKFTKQKSQTDQLKVEPINQHIKPVESVVYEERQVRTYTYQHQTNNYTVSGKENTKDYEHENTYKVKQKAEKNYSGALQIAKHNHLKVKEQEKTHSQTKVHQKSTTPSKKQDEVKKEKSVKKQQDKHQPTNKLTNHQINQNKTKVNQEPKKPHKYEDPYNFDDLDLLLGKITNVPKPQPQEIRQSISNISSASNVYNSINMDPYL